MALFPRETLAFSQPIIEGAYGRVKQQPTESHVRALCHGYFGVYYPPQAFLPMSETYYPATSQQKKHGHKFWKMDAGYEFFRGEATKFVTHTLIEVKPSHQSERQDEEALQKLEDIGQACCQHEKTDFVWMIQFYGTEIALKRYDPKNGLVPQDDLSKDFLDVRQGDARIAAKIEKIRQEIPLPGGGKFGILESQMSQSERHSELRQPSQPQRRHDDESRPYTSAAARHQYRSSQSPAPQQSLPSRHRDTQQQTESQSQSMPSFEQMTEVSAPLTKHNGRKGRVLKARDGKHYLIPEERWVKAVIRGQSVWYYKQANAYTVRD